MSVIKKVSNFTSKNYMVILLLAVTVVPLYLFYMTPESDSEDPEVQEKTEGFELKKEPEDKSEKYKSPPPVPSFEQLTQIDAFALDMPVNTYGDLKDEKESPDYYEGTMGRLRAQLHG
tara:strand:+ start:1958 stop:2311 length:354 start_codon:yes stop_codon:yes gene_type:complete